jgi:hypothetical protein
MVVTGGWEAEAMRRTALRVALTLGLLLLLPAAASAAPPVHRQRWVELPHGAALDLDTARTDGRGLGDLRVTGHGAGALLRPTGGATIRRMGSSRPSYGVCTRHPTSSDPVGLHDQQPWTWFCARTSAGRVARFQIVGIDPATDAIRFRFVTWKLAG